MLSQCKRKFVSISQWQLIRMNSFRQSNNSVLQWMETRQHHNSQKVASQKLSSYIVHTCTAGGKDP